MTQKKPSKPMSCPAWLEGDASGEWNRVLRAGVKEGVDADAIAAYCTSLALWRRVDALIRTLEENDILSWTHPDGRARQHPALAIEARLTADLTELAEAIGLEDNGLDGRHPTRILVLDEGPSDHI